MSKLDKLILNGTEYDIDSSDSGLSDDAKQALLACFQQLAWIGDDGQEYYDALIDALYPEAPPATLVSITAVYTQSGTVYDTDSLDSLKSDLVVTAHYDDTTTATVPSYAYSLNGSLEEGTSTIAVSYNGKTTTFTVNVTLSRETRFGTFIDGHTISKSGGGTVPQNGLYVAAYGARAAISTPIVNNGYVLTVTDSSKYNLSVNGVTDNTPIETTWHEAIEGVYYTGDTTTNTWETTDSALDAPYIYIALKKMDNTSFTAEELANGAEAVFTYTES